MRKIYVSPLVSEFETGVESGFCGSNGEGQMGFSLNTDTDGYYDEEE